MKLRFKKELFRKKKISFSLSEVLITVVIVALLTAVLILLLKNAKPDKNEILHKKSSFIVNKVLNKITTDEFLYPNNGEYTGLSNTSIVTINGQVPQAKQNFAHCLPSGLT